MTRIIFTFSLLTLFTLSAYGQTCSTQPGFICISQNAANVAAQNARELAATKDKVTTLETVITGKDATIAENKTAAAKNEADLKAQLNKVTADLATATGQIIGLNAQATRDAAIMDVLLKNSRKKCIAVICL